MGRCVRIEGEVLRRAERFGIPADGAGVVVAALPLAWAWVDNHFQPIVYCRELQYPNCELATAREIELMVGGAR